MHKKYILGTIILLFTLTGCRETSVFEKHYVRIEIPGYTNEDYIELLEAYDPELRYIAVANLIESNGSSGVSALPQKIKRLLTDDSPKVRSIAAFSVNSIDDDQFEDILINLTNDQSSAVRLEAIATLGKKFSQSPKSAQAMLNRLNDRSILVRLQAIESLEEFRKSTLRGEIVRKLLKQLASVNQIEQLRLIKTLGLIGEQTEIESDLLEKISTNNEAMVTTVIEALGRIKSTSSIKIFSQLIEDNQERNEVIIEALSSIGSPEALQVLINRLLHKKNPEVRIAAIEAIGKFEGESGQEELVKEFYLELATAIKEADSVKWADFNSYSEISALMNAIERKITVNNDSTNELAIKRLLESKKEYERIVVLSLLTEGNPYDRNVIGSRAEDQSLFPLLEQTVSDPSIFIRIWGIHALGNMTNSGVISILEKAIMDPVFGIRYAAVKSLVRYAHNTSNYSPLRKLFEQKDNFIPTVYTKEDKNFLIRESIEEAIVAVEPEYLTHQRRISELTSSSAPTRMIAALQLVEKSDNLSIPVLIVFLKEGTIGEQQSALGGLEKFYRLPQDAILHLQAIHAKIDDMTLKEKINQIIIKSQKLCNEEDVN